MEEKIEHKKVMTKHEKECCISYPEDKQMVVLKVLFLFIASSIFVYLAYDYFKNKIDITFISLLIMGFGGLYASLFKLHGILAYDEICVQNEYFIVKKRKKVLSKTPIKDIYIVSRTSPFDMFQIAWKQLYRDDVLLFHYKTNEITKEDEEKLTKLIEKGNKNAR